MAEERKRLGRGLAALLGDVAEPEVAVERAGVRQVPVEFLKPNQRNPRRSFSDADLADLAQSVKEKGIIQPILARPVKGSYNQFEIIAGERRWRAAQRAGLHEVPVLVQDVSDREALELAIIENVQRADLNAVEEALGYDSLMSEFAYTQQDLAQIIGKSRSHVANTLRLLKLPESVLSLLREGLLTAGHARALINAPDPEALAKRIVAEGLTVRDIEALAQAEAEAAKPADAANKGGRPKKTKDADTLALERSLTERIGLTVSIGHRADQTGEVKIRYQSLEQLDELLKLFNG